MNEFIQEQNWVKYRRKSTDREDVQANSLEHQEINCNKTATNYNIKIVKDIFESKSAKTEWKRPWFKELIKFCKSWKVDYIIVDEPKRLSRNNRDNSDIIDLLDKKYIKWVLCSNRTYLANNISDVFLLQLDLSLSKMDNENRSKEVKEKMLTHIERTGKFPWKAPYWYKNITINKFKRDIIIDKKEAKIVREIFNLRIEWNAFSNISIMLKEKYKINFSVRKIHAIATNKFYYWVFKWSWKDNIGTHKSIIKKPSYKG